MKSSSNYGSDNEESNFIRRVAAPDRPSSKRRHKKRLALAGAATILIGATAGVGYVTLQSSQFATIATPVKQQMSANLVVPDFVESMGDPYYPTFDELDEDGDGVVAYSEYMKDLNEVWAMDKENIASSDLPQIVKDDLYDQLNDKITSDSACVKKAMIPTKKRTLTFDRKTIDSLYYMLEVYCFDTPIEVPEKYNKMFPDTQAPVPPPAPVIPEVPAPPSAATSAPIVIPSSGGEQTVTLVGPPVDGVQKVEIDTSGSGKVTTTVDVKETISGGEKLDIPDPGGKTTTITVPENEVPTDNGESEKKVEIETVQGPATVTINGPAINGTQDVTITDANGGTTTTTVDVTQTTDGKTKLEIPTGTDGQTTIVTVPQTSTAGSNNNAYSSGSQTNNAYSSGSQTNAQTQKARKVDIDTSFGRVTVVFNGPVTAERTQSVTILKNDGSDPQTLTLDVLQYATDNSLWVQIPLGPGENPRRVRIPDADGTSSTGTGTGTSTAGSNNNAYSSGSQTNNAYSSGSQTNAQTQKVRKVDIDTSFGRVTVVFNGPVTAERTQSVTILKNDGSDPQTLTLDVLQYATDNSLWVQIPLGPGENPRRVRIPDADGTSSTGTGTGTSTAGSNNNAYSSGSQTNNAYSSGSQTNAQTQKVRKVDIDTSFGRVTVVFNGPVTAERTQSVTILKNDGSDPQTLTLDVLQYATDNSLWVQIPLGPGENPRRVRIPDADGTSSTGTGTGTSTAGSNNNAYSSGSQTNNAYSSGSQTNAQTQKVRKVDIDTSFGRVTVVFNGPVTAERTQSVTILKNDGSDPQTLTLDVLQYATDNSLWVQIPLGPGENPRRVRIPDADGTSSTGTGTGTSTAGSNNNAYSSGSQTNNAYSSGSQTNAQTQKVRKVDIDTSFGRVTVVFNGPVTAERTQSVTILKNDGSDPQTLTLDVLQYATDNSLWVQIPLGPGENPRRVRIPDADGTSSTGTGTGTSTAGSNNNAYSSGSQTNNAYSSGSQTNAQTQKVRKVDIDTSFGRVTVVFNGPVTAERTQSVTILKNDGSDPQTLTLDVLQYATDNSLWVQIPLGPGENPRRVRIPDADGTSSTGTGTGTSTAGSNNNAYSSGSQTNNAYSSGSQTNAQTQKVRKVDIDTSFGRVTVVFNGPVTAERTQSVTILKNDGSDPQTLTLDVLQYATDNSLWVQIPLGPGENPRRVRIPDADGTSSTGTGTGTSTAGSNNNAYSSGSQTNNAYSSGSQTNAQTQKVRKVDIDTSFGRVTVVFNGPVTAERTQSVTILKNDGSDPQTLTLDVLQYATDNSLWVQIPLGPGENPRRVRIPDADGTSSTGTGTGTSTAGSNNNAYSSGSQTNNAYSSGSQTNAQTQKVRKVDIDTSFGRVTVVFNGPVTAERTQSVTILKNDGSDPQTLTLDVLQYATDNSLWVQIPLGPGENPRRVRIPDADGTSSTGTGTGTSTAGSNNNAYSSGSQTNNAYSSGSQTNAQTQKVRKVDIDTSFGRVTVVFNGPVTAERTQSVTILKNDGSDPQTLTLDVLQYATDNSLWVQIPLGPGENPRRVRIPDADGTSSTGTGTGTSTAGSNNNAYSSGSQTNNAYSSGSQTNTQNQKPPSVEVDAATGFWTVIFVSPVTDGTVNVLIDRHDGNVPTPKTLKVSVWTDGRKMVKLETGPDGQTTTMEVPEWPEGLAWAGPNGGLPSPSVIVDTPHGPVTVTTDGPVIDGKQQVTITTPDGGTTTTTVEVTPTSDGKNALEIPTGPEGQSTIVTVSQNPSEGGAGSSQTNPKDAATKILVDTNLGPATVTIDGPAIDGKQDVVIMTPNGGTTKTTVDVTQTTDGKTELEIPTGPGGTTTTVSVPTTSTEGGGGVSTTDILNQLGGNDIDNGDKDFMSKDEFQLQIGTHFSEKIMSLNKQARDEEAESDKLLNQQKKLQDCILQASNKFGYYGVYEQPPYFQNAVDWVDNDCLKH